MYKITDFNKTALIFKDKKISYKELKLNNKKYSKLFNLKDNSKVGLFFENRPEWLYTFFGSWKKGGQNVLIDAMATSEEVAHIVNDSDTEVIITSNKSLDTLQKAIKSIGKKENINVINIDQITDEDFKYEEGKYEKKPEEVGALIYTSGTTGSPKGVMLTMKNFMTEIKSISKLNMVKKEEKVLVILPFHHVYPLTATMLIPIQTGMTLVFVDTLTGDAILSAMNKYKVNVVVAVPRIFELFHSKIMSQINSNKTIKLLHNLSKKIYNLKVGRTLFKKVHDKFGGEVGLFISGGAKLDKKIVEDFWAMGFKILEGYGLTETAPIIALNERWGKIKAGSVGEPIPGTEIKLVDKEIVVKSDVVMKGYYKNKKATEKVLKNGWFYTGDKGYFDNEGYLYVTGRKKDTIILSNGKNVNPVELENKIKEMSDLIQELAVVEYNNQLLAIIYPNFNYAKENKILNIRETIKWKIIDKYNLEASNYKKIGDIRIVNEELPKTRIGKIKRFKIKEVLEEGIEKKSKKEEPNFEEYNLLKEFIKKEKHKNIYADDHLELDIGMDSLDKVELQYYIEETFGIHLDSEDFLEYMVVEDLASYIQEKKIKIENKDVNWSEIFKKDNDSIEIDESTMLLKGMKSFLKPILKGYFNLEIKGKENIPKTGPMLITPNHQSFLDAFLISLGLDDKILKDTYFLAKSKHFESKLRKSLAKKTNILVVDINKNLEEGLQKTAKVFDNNKNMVLFPEGARSRTGEIMKFKKVFSILSKEKKVPIIPVVIKGAYEAFSIGNRIPKFKKKIVIEYMPAVYPEKKSYEKIRNEVRAIIKERFNDITIK
ncbi:MAG: AMP-binding protein [Fusobacteriota bacterium]